MDNKLYLAVWNILGFRKQGMPRLTWLEDSENDTQDLKVKRWRQMTGKNEHVP